MVDIYTASEEAFKRGQEKGMAEGYRRGFCAGVAASGIAPVQWRDAREAPFEPERDKYYMIWLLNKHESMIKGEPVLADMPRMIHGSTAWGLGAVAYWCPVNRP